MQIENKLAVLILCGGKGTRLGINFKNNNKSLIKVNNQTLISININYLFKQKFSNIFVLTGHAHKKVEKEVNKKFKKKVYLNFTGLNSNITLRIKKTLKLLNEFQYVLIMNGDSLYNFNLKKIFYETFKKNIDCSFICTSKIIKYGFLRIDHKKAVKSFSKNPKISNFSNNENYLFYPGICFIKKELLKKNINKIKKNFELNLFNKFIRKNKTKVFFDNGKFQDFNNLEDIQGLKK
jgi:D-glycero-alpha-D-manno-heptose 1-phosphate guanylyltransferase